MLNIRKGDTIEYCLPGIYEEKLEGTVIEIKHNVHGDVIGYIIQSEYLCLVHPNDIIGKADGNK